MAAPFSWSDTLHITFSSCLPCIRPTNTGGVALDSDNEDQPHNPAINRIPRARPDELQGLLADPDTDPEAETMSLHSNPGRTKRNRKKHRSSKKASTSSSGLQKSRNQITLFGYTLFGSAVSQPIELPEDAEDALYAGSSSHSNSNVGSRTRSGRQRNESLTAPSIGTAASTASTFDLDAAPLDADTIDALSSSTAAAAAIEAAAKASAAAEATRLKEKEERRQKRRERKEMKRLAQVLTSQAGGEEFEGFQGSGGDLSPSYSTSGYSRISNAMNPTLGTPGRAFSASDSGSGSGFSGSARDGFGRFVSAPNGAPLVVPQHPEDDDDEAADLDGKLYSRTTPNNGPGAGSDSRSRTSASVSDRPSPLVGGGTGFSANNNVLTNLRSRSHSYSQSSSSRVNSPSHAQLNFYDVRSQSTGMSTPPIVPGDGMETTQHKPHKSHKKPKSKASSRTSDSVSSPSIPSPISPSFSSSRDTNSKSQRQEIVSPSTVEHGQGFFDLDDELVPPVRVGTGARLVVGEREQMQQQMEVEKEEEENKKENTPSRFPSTRIGGGGGGGGFPSTGFGGGGGARRAKDFGAFLARRGDDEDADH